MSLERNPAADTVKSHGIFSVGQVNSVVITSVVVSNFSPNSETRTQPDYT